MINPKPSNYKSGFVAVVGRPNVGKSTLINRIMGQEVSIVTPKEQTTRNRINAIYSTNDVQLILQDTPGLHDPKTPLNKTLVSAARKTIEDADAVLFMTSPSPAIHDEDKNIINLIKSSNLPCVLAVNKIDKNRPEVLLPFVDIFRGRHEFDEVFLISALNGSGVEDLLKGLIKLLPEGTPLFPEDEISDLPTRFFVAELIREQIILKTGQEIPYKSAVVVETFREEADRVLIQADIHVERDSQKKIIVGKQGTMIKSIGISARQRIEDFLDSRVRLELFVKITPNWSRSAGMLKEFGYQGDK